MRVHSLHCTLAFVVAAAVREPRKVVNIPAFWRKELSGAAQAVSLDKLTDLTIRKAAGITHGTKQFLVAERRLH